MITLDHKQDAEQVEAIQAGQPAPHRSRVINRDYVKRWALDYCASHTLFSKKNKVRVSEQFLNMIEAATKSAIIYRIESCQPSAKAKTLQ